MRILVVSFIGVLGYSRFIGVFREDVLVFLDIKLF